MFLRQIVIQRGIPFEMKLPAKRPLAMGELTKEQFDAELLSPEYTAGQVERM